MKRIFTLLYIYTAAICANAQGRILPITDICGSPEAMALGSSRTVHTSSAFIFTNPLAAFDAESNNEMGENSTFNEPNSTFNIRNSKFDLAYSLGFIDLSDSFRPVHSLSASYAKGRHSVMAGARFYDMGSIKTFVNDDMQETPRDAVSCKSYLLEAGYAYRFTRNIAAFATIGYAKENALTDVSAYRASIGAEYANLIRMGSRNAAYNITLAAANIGRYSYAESDGNLSPSLTLGGSLLMPIASQQSLRINAEGTMFMQSGDSPSTTQASLGITYRLQRLAFMVGGHTGDGLNCASAGIAYHFNHATISAACQLPFHQMMFQIAAKL